MLKLFQYLTFSLVLSVMTTFAVLTPARAETVEIFWDSLIPPGVAEFDLNGLLFDSSTPSGISYDPNFFPLNETLNGVKVRIAGYVVPLTFDGTVVNNFMLVPYVGACIHVPPPPPNQIVYVTSDIPLKVTELFIPVWVDGTLLTRSKRAEIAYSGYTLEAEQITLYEM